MTFLPRTWNEDLQLSLQRIALDQGRRPDDDICILVALVLRELPGWTRQHVADVVRRQPPTTPFSLHLLDDADHAPFAICRLHRDFGTRGATAYLEQISKDMHKAMLGRGRSRIAADEWRGGYVPVVSLARVLRRTPDEIKLVATTSYSQRRRTPRFRMIDTDSPAPLVTSVKLVTRTQAVETADACEVRMQQAGNASGGACCICLTSAVTCAMPPCGHYCACAECASSWESGSGICPLCRRPVQAVLRIYPCVGERELSRATPAGA